MTSMQGDQDGLGDALRQSFERRVRELSERSNYSGTEKDKADAAHKNLQERLIRRGGYHRFLSVPNAKLFFDDFLKEKNSFVLLSKFLKEMGLIMRTGHFHESDNIHIPAGYTYLFQFTAHDIVQSSSQSIRFADYRLPVLNRRRSGLSLETLFDGGPTSCPFVFEGRGGVAHDKDKQVPERMRVGRTLPDNGGPITPKRDILRARYEFNGGAPTLERKQADCPYIADIRNDDNFIISQLTLLFHQYFNEVLSVLIEQKKHPNVQSLAMAVTTRVYRNIVRHDLLPKLINCDIKRRYEAKNPKFIDDQSEYSVSREFAFAAVRVGHSMVRKKYSLNSESAGKKDKITVSDIVRASSSRDPQGLSKIEEWAINWKLFFDFDKNKRPADFNLAHNFSLGAAGTLTSSSTVAHPVLDALDERNPTGLHARDIVRAATERLWSVAALMQQICNKDKALGALIGADPKDASVAQQRVIEVMKSNLAQAGVVPGSNHELSKNAILYSIATEDPPLIAYLLAEANLEGKGKLGPLGSILVSEVFYRWLAEDTANEAEQAWLAQVEAVSQEVHDGCEPNDMVSLINFVAERQK